MNKLKRLWSIWLEGPAETLVGSSLWFIILNFADSKNAKHWQEWVECGTAFIIGAQFVLTRGRIAYKRKRDYYRVIYSEHKYGLLEPSILRKELQEEARATIKVMPQVTMRISTNIPESTLVSFYRVDENGNDTKSNDRFVWKTFSRCMIARTVPLELTWLEELKEIKSW